MIAHLKLFVLGAPRLERDEGPIELNLRKALALLVYLAMSDQPQTRDALATLLWPDSDQREGRGRLRRTLYRLQEAIGDQIVDSQPETIRLHRTADLWLDCAAFREHATAGLAVASVHVVAPERLAHLEAAVELYSEDFLAGFTLPDSPSFDEWQFFVRESLRQLYGQVLEQLVQAYRSQQVWNQAIGYARRWVALDGLHEPAHRILMRLYAWAGQHAAALRQYQECTQLLAAELGAMPEDETTALYDAIRFRRFTPPRDDRSPRSQQGATAFPPQRGDRATPPGKAVSSRGGDDSMQLRTGARTTRTVGREAELRRLQEHLERALEGTRQIVFVAGEPGIGKTTLVNLLLDNMHDSGSLWIGRGQCLEHRGIGEAYMPLLEALGRLCRGSDGQELIDLLADRAPTWLVQMPGLISVEQLTALQPKVLGTTRERMLRELVELIDSLTSRRPLVLVLEDLHWSDYSTLDVLAMVARQQEAARLLVIGTYRPADVQANGHPLHEIARQLHLRGYATAIDLTLLTEAAVERYLQTRFGAAAFLDGLARLLYQRTDGNPLFMVTVVDAWLDHGLLQEVDGRWMFQGALDELANHIPETLRQLIELQIEQLDAGDQAILEAASVAGTTFSAAEVAAAVEQEQEAVELRCTTLARRQHFLRERETGEWPDGTIAVQFEWSHHVIQQVLYARVTATRRARLHRQIGLRLEAGYHQAARMMAAELATHFVRGRDRPRALQYLKLAAEQALSRSAHREAIELLKLGLDLLQHWPETPERTEHELALQAMLAPALIATQGWGSSEAEHAYLRARDLCTTLGGSRQRDQVLFGLATMLEFRAEYQQSAALMEQQLRIDRRKGRELLVESYDLLACSLFHQGSFTAALHQAEQGLNLYDPQQQYALIARFGENPGVGCHIWSALSLWFLGYPDKALGSARLAVHQAQDHLYSLANAQTHLACIHQLRREDQLTRQYAEMAIAVATQQGFPYRAAVGRMLQGWAVAVQGQVEDGIRLLHEGLDACLAMGAMLDYPYFLTLLADACSHADQIDEGLIALAGAQAMVLNSRSFYYEAELHRLKGSLLLQTSREANIDDAEACFTEGLAVARRQQAKSLELRAAVSLGRLWQQQGKQAEAHHLVAETCSWFTEGFDTVDLQQAQAFLREREHEGLAVSQG